MTARKLRRYNKLHKISTGVNPFYDGGSIAAAGAKGAMAGAATGSVIPGWGTVAGTIIGGGTAIASEMMGQNVAEKAETETERANTLNKIATASSGGGSYVNANGNEVNPYAMGGDLQTIDAGGSHEQNPNGGIMVGIGANGKPNTVEEGETKFGDIVYSKSIPFEWSVAFPKFLKKAKTPEEATKLIDKAFEGRMDKYSLDTRNDLYDRVGQQQQATTDAMQPKVQPNGQNQLRRGQYDKGTYVGSPALYSIEGEDAEELAFINNTSSVQKGVQDYIDSITSDNIPTTDAENLGDISGIIGGIGGEWNKNKENVNTNSTMDSSTKWGLASQGVGLVSNMLSLYRDTKNKPDTIVPEKVSRSSLRTNLVNRQAIMREITNTASTSRKAIAENSGGDFGTYASNIAGVNSGALNASSMAMLEADVTDAAEKDKVRQLEFNLDSMDARARTAAKIANEQNMAAYYAQLSEDRFGLTANISNIGTSLMNLGIAKETGKQANIIAKLNT